MALSISTFSNQSGMGSAFFKAVGHPLCVPQAQALVKKIKAARRAIAYDPHDTLTAFASLYPLGADDFSAVLAQAVPRFGGETLGLPVQPITALENADADVLFIPLFQPQALLNQIAAIIPPGCEVLSLQEMQLPERFLADRCHYLNPLNFATNLLFFRDEDNCHTRLVTANYWSVYGAKEPFVWGRLFDRDGATLVDFEKPLGAGNELFELDSAALREEFNLPPFCGQVFLHVAAAAGHDIVKYVVDTYGSGDKADSELSCTHDANSWPADLYAGVPAPAADDTVILWVQNSHPAPIPAGAVGVARMGEETVHAYPDEIPPYATRAVNVGELAPGVHWPAQLEIHAGRHFVRPRYEVVNGSGRRRINHANVERTDLMVDDQLPTLAQWVGKGYILPAPVLPRGEFISECLPTPMSTAQQTLPYSAVLYNRAGEEINRVFLGCLPRRHDHLVNLTELAQALPEAEAGHVEIVYDFRDGGGGDGWIHSLFRYTEKNSRHCAETSFGSHMFNHLVTYKNEPQSYKGPPPGLTTRLFLRIKDAPARTMCHLTYPVGVKWHAHSSTVLELKTRRGAAVAQQTVNIPAGGCYLFYCDEVFTGDQLAAAGSGAYVVVRDTSCRLFGYHGARVGSAFAFDHMFGF